MTTQDLSAGLAAALGGAEGTSQENVPVGEPTPGGNEPSAVGSSASYDTNGLSPYAQNFLAGLPEDKRSEAANYVREWDKGFTQHSQRLNGELTRYSQFGTVEQLQQQASIIEQLKADPVGFTKFLIDNGIVTLDALAPQQQNQQPSQPQYFDANGQPVQLPPAAPQPPAVDPRYQRLETAIGALGQQLAAQRNAAEAKEADQALENLTTQAEQKYGKFDRGYVYQLMAQGLTIDAAVQGWKNMIASYTAQQTPPPGVMGASSAPPPTPGPLNSSEERTNALVQWLGQNR